MTGWPVASETDVTRTATSATATGPDTSSHVARRPSAETRREPGTGRIGSKILREAVRGPSGPIVVVR